jgi:hypothetical protein
MATPEIYRTYVIVDVGFGPESYQVSGIPDGMNPQFVDLFRTFDTSVPFTLLGAEIQSGQDGLTDIDSATFFWRVYQSGDVPGAFSPIALALCCDENGTDCDTGGSCVDSGFPSIFRKLWRENGQLIDVLAGQYVGEFLFEFYFEIESSSTSEIENEGTSGSPIVLNYCRALESFTDGNFTSNLVWTGDVANWQIVFNSDVAGGATASNTLRLNVPSGAGVQHMRSSYSQWSDEQEWSFWIGRRSQSYTATNNVAIWLYANQPNLEAANINGYRVVIGDDVANPGSDAVRLQRVTNGVATQVIGGNPMPNGLTNIGIQVRVTRDQFGNWALFTSTLPALSGQGPTATDCINATVSGGSGSDNTYNLTGLNATGYFGIVATHTSGVAGRTAVELDQFTIRVIPAPPVDGCTDQSACNYNPFAINDDGSCTYPGCTDTDACNFDPNADCEDGSCTYPGCQDPTACNYDPDAGCPDICSYDPPAYFERFTDGDFTANPVWTGDTGSWLVVADSDVAGGSVGSQTLRLNFTTNAAGIQHLSTPYSAWEDEQEWGFWLGRRGQTYTAANNVAIWLYADQTNLEAANINGYRLRIGDDSGVDEFVLQRVTNGVATAVITANAGFTNGITNVGVQVRVTRTYDGQWELFTGPLATNNGEGPQANTCPFNHTSRGTGSDATYIPSGTGHMGIVVTHSSGGAARVAVEFDDFAITTNTVIFGCTDPLANNYDPMAAVDDGSCTYTVANLVITEIHYNPDDAAGFPDAQYEFLEIYNNDAVTWDISGYAITNAVNFTFPAGTFIAPGEYIIVAINAATYASLTCQVFQWTGQLNNTGETIEIYDINSQLVDIVTYSNSSPWPTAANGSGPSLELIDANLDNNNGANWVAQTINGTPCGPILTLNGCTDPSANNYDVNATVDDGSCAYDPATVIINEIHYDPCNLQGTDAIFEFLEIYNADPVNTINISGWQIVGVELTFPAGTFIAPGEYIVIAKTPATYTGNGYQVFGFGTPGSGLNNTGEPLSILDDLGNVIDYVSYMPGAPWPVPANGQCPSLELIDPFSNNADPSNWQLSFVSGGTPGGLNSNGFDCDTCDEPNAVTEIVYEEDFETFSLSGWQLSNAAHWSVSSTAPINGSASLKHEGGGLGTAYASRPVACAGLTGVCTVWQFQGRYDFTPSATNRFLYYLASNQANLNFPTISGYAVGLNYFTNNNVLTLYQVTSGAFAEIMSLPFVIPNGNNFSIEVILDENGQMMLKYDYNGGFDLMLQAQVGPVLVTGVSVIGHTGVRFQHTAVGAGSLRFDDILITQCANVQDYYSQSTGSFDGAIWATAPVGPSISFASNKFANVIVQNGHTVTMTKAETIRNTTVQNGGTLVLSNFIYDVFGNIQVDNGGLYNGHPGHTRLSCGFAAQQIVSNGETRFGTLTLNNINGAAVSGSGQVLQRGTFFPTNGTFDAGTGQYILDANGTYAGFIATIQPTADVIGDVTVRTFIPAAPVWNGSSPTTGNGWVALSSVSQNQTLANWSDDILMTGFPGTPFPNYWQSVYWYDETVPGTRDLGFTVPTSTSNPIVPWLGYFTYVLQTSQMTQTTGQIFKDFQTWPLSRTVSLGGFNDGWNIVGNSYPAPIDFDAIFFANDPVPLDGNDAPSFFYVYDQEIYGYRIWNTLTQTGNTSRYIGRGQGIFTFVNDNFINPVIEESHKYTGFLAPVAIERNGDSHPMVSLKLSQGNMEDEAFLLWHHMATDEVEIGLDTPKFGGAVQVSLVQNEDDFGIAAYSQNFNSTSIPVRVKVTEEWIQGTYTLSFPEVENLPEGICLNIEDLSTGETFPIELGLTFDLAMSGIMDEIKFVIHVTKVANISSVNATCYNANNASITIDVVAQGVWDLWLMDQNGQTIVNETAGSDALQLNNLEPGTYILVLGGEDSVCGSLTYNIEVTQPEDEIFITWKENVTCDWANGIIGFDVENVSSYNLQITDESGFVFINATDLEGEQEWDGFGAGIYTISYQTGCFSGFFMADLNDPNAMTAGFTVSAETVELINGQALVEFFNQSVNATDFLWSINGQTVSNAEDFIYNFTEEGTYLVVMEASNAGCSAFASQTVLVEQGVNVSEQMTGILSMVQMGDDLAITLGTAMSAAMLDIYDNVGRLVHSVQLNLPSGQTRVALPAGLATGIYTVRLFDKHQSAELRIVR